MKVCGLLRVLKEWPGDWVVLLETDTYMAQPLSRVNPRQGRFGKLLPAVFLYVAYLSLLLAAVDAIGGGSLAVAVGVWPVHGLFLGLGLLLLWHSQRKGVR